MRNLKQFIKCLLTPEKQKKETLYKKIYGYYYTSYMAQINNHNNGIIIPDFLVEGRISTLAMQRAKKDLENVINECNLNKYYLKAIEG